MMDETMTGSWFDYILTAIVILLYVESWLDAFRLRNIIKRLDNLESKYERYS